MDNVIVVVMVDEGHYPWLNKEVMAVVISPMVDEGLYPWLNKEVMPVVISPMVDEKMTIPRTFMPSLFPGRVRTSTSGGGVRSSAKFWMSVPLSSWIP